VLMFETLFEITSKDVVAAVIPLIAV